jgi:hypothetical protein
VSLGALREGMGDWTGSEALFREALAIHRKVLAPDDLALATSLNDLALVVGQEEKFEESEKLYRESMAIRRKRLGNEHPFVAQSLNNIGMLYVRHASAIWYCSGSLEISQAVGTVHLSSAQVVAEEALQASLELDRKSRRDQSALRAY